MTTNLTIGQIVTRIQPGDYTNGRMGEVLEIDVEKMRARVLWTKARGYDTPGTFTMYNITRPLRTWVSFKCLKVDA